MDAGVEGYGFFAKNLEYSQSKSVGAELGIVRPPRTHSTRSARPSSVSSGPISRPGGDGQSPEKFAKAYAEFTGIDARSRPKPPRRSSSARSSRPIRSSAGQGVQRARGDPQRRLRPDREVLGRLAGGERPEEVMCAVRSDERHARTAGSDGAGCVASACCVAVCWSIAVALPIGVIVIWQLAGRRLAVRRRAADAGPGLGGVAPIGPSAPPGSASIRTAAPGSPTRCSRPSASPRVLRSRSLVGVPLGIAIGW